MRRMTNSSTLRRSGQGAAARSVFASLVALGMGFMGPVTRAEADSLEGVTVMIRSKDTGRCLYMDKSHVATAGCNWSAPNQRWRILDGHKGRYHIKNVDRGDCLGGFPLNNNEVFVGYCDDHNKWFINGKVMEASIFMQSSFLRACLDGTSDGSAFTWACHDTDRQRWALLKV
ncbi:hypothetical protein A6A06_25005 [Streptomyces sp. CB02923]|uniref:RICIN domain-containing protein n=1 Tax=Streptomyces sp. CB02923 TaxID=1718985 RepID=UPI000962AFEA|nr:RICIN domain-containing protein [Streptomyces sp. CB02923]OKH98880.1 hypothetical protein A6A06_25005 [Streptomyces sp. CB02923]